MTRPSGEDVERAQRILEALLDDVAGSETRASVGIERVALHTLREAVKPREMWLAYEVSNALDVTSANLRDVAGLPAPAQTLPRPTATQPDKVLRMWWADEIEEFAKSWRAERRRT